MFGITFERDSLKAMDLGFFNCKMILLAFHRAIPLSMIISLSWKFFGMRSKILVPFLVAYMVNAHAMSMERLRVFNTRIRSCNCWWGSMNLLPKSEGRFCWWILCLHSIRFAPCWFKNRNKGKLALETPMDLLLSFMLLLQRSVLDLDLPQMVVTRIRRRAKRDLSAITMVWLDTLWTNYTRLMAIHQGISPN